jgi:hypothetical protein
MSVPSSSSRLLLQDEVEVRGDLARGLAAQFYGCKRLQAVTLNVSIAPFSPFKCSKKSFFLSIGDSSSPPLVVPVTLNMSLSPTTAEMTNGSSAYEDLTITLIQPTTGKFLSLRVQSAQQLDIWHTQLREVFAGTG